MDTHKATRKDLAIDEAAWAAGRGDKVSYGEAVKAVTVGGDVVAQGQALQDIRIRSAEQLAQDRR